MLTYHSRSILTYIDQPFFATLEARREFQMSTVEERLAKVERELELLRAQQTKWPIAEVDIGLQGDPTLTEIFRLANAESEPDSESGGE